VLAAPAHGCGSAAACAQELLEAKLAELKGAVQRTTGAGENVRASQSAGAAPLPKQTRAFVSYCWANSKLAQDAGHISGEAQNQLADPRAIANKLNGAGIPTWLDIERLAGGKGLFEDIATGLINTEVVIACISDEYAKCVQRESNSP
jgi:hypothetical protein